MFANTATNQFNKQRAQTQGWMLGVYVESNAMGRKRYFVTGMEDKEWRRVRGTQQSQTLLKQAPQPGPVIICAS